MRPDWRSFQAWLKARVGFCKVPDLRQGTRLIGGRVAPGVAAPAGFLIYERRRWRTDCITV